MKDPAWRQATEKDRMNIHARRRRGDSRIARKAGGRSEQREDPCKRAPRRGNNPSVSPMGCQLPLHKGAFFMPFPCKRE